MKVLQLTTHLDIGGISTYVVSLARKLKEKGMEVFCASAGGYLVSDLNHSGIPHVAVPMKTKNELDYKLLFSFLDLSSFIKEEKIDVIHAHTRVAQVVASALSRFSKVRYVSTCHGFYRRRFLRRLYPCWGDRTVAVSEPVREMLVNDFDLAKSRIALIPHGVETDEFRPKLTEWDKKDLRRYFHLKEDGFVIGGVFRLIEAKGIQYLIKAIPSVLDVFPDTSFFLVGEGPHRDVLEKLIGRLHLTSHVVLAGRQERVSVPLELMDIFVMPSVSGEGFGMAVLEAMAGGKPVVATDVGSIYTLVKDGVNGFLIPPKDPKVLADKLVELMRNKDLMVRMASEGRRIAAEHFSLERVADQMYALYSEVAKG
ncbi:MAG: glycosyltransferase family 4 protein [Candidatus Omnitrophica bacterium]|nr:glycosyltransferase family 4 protein [Candidatus Omnitrophota bacterium]